ncbi:MAG: hypothetical protein WCO26_18680 [Deltaproteobacteria bacterium]
MLKCIKLKNREYWNDGTLEHWNNGMMGKRKKGEVNKNRKTLAFLKSLPASLCQREETMFSPLEKACLPVGRGDEGGFYSDSFDFLGVWLFIF